jgi:hypothetical protein
VKLPRRAWTPSPWLLLLPFFFPQGLILTAIFYVNAKEKLRS